MSDIIPPDPTMQAPPTAPDPIENALREAGAGLEPVADTAPVYKMMPQSRIPVSRRRGQVWRARKDNTLKMMEPMKDAWDEVIRYYNNDQSSHREDHADDMPGNRKRARASTERHSQTENLIFANTTAQVPRLYAKNPIITLTANPTGLEEDQKDSDAFARVTQKLVNVLFSMHHSPGVNIKPKAKRNVLIALLTNRAWFEVGYTKKDQSSEQALADLAALSLELQGAKDEKTIRKVEGKLQALEEKIEILQPSGPYVRIRLPHQVLVDPDHNDPYGTDANWMIIGDMISTEYINAVYGEEDPETGVVRSIFEPTHILNGKGQEEDDEGNFTLFNKEKTGYSAYGYQDDASFKKAQRTKVWYVWDKTTRRVEMYADNDWTWPIWVVDDPYNLQGFFPFVPMQFHDNPIAVYAKGEATYYLDQQDQINDINSEKHLALRWGRQHWVYDSNSGITQTEVEKILKGPDATATPIAVPEGKKLEELLKTIIPPSMNFQGLFDKTDLYAAIDRLSGSNEAERGGQFKTNTTNQAIDYYSTMGSMRNDMKLDAIEDSLGRVGWMLAQLCMQFMDADTVTQLTGLDAASVNWGPLDPLRNMAKWSMVCVGGSTQKLSTQAKKQEATQVGQILSQYVRAAPHAVLKVSLRLFSKAFDDFVVTQEDWDTIAQEIAMTAGPAGMMDAAGGPKEGSNGTQQGMGGNPVQMAQMMVQMMQTLPPEMLRGIGMALSQGVPPDQILQAILGGPNGGPTEQPQPTVN